MLWRKGSTDKAVADARDDIVCAHAWSMGSDHVLAGLAGGSRWGVLVGSTLISVEFFTVPDDEGRRVVGVKHVTTHGSFWVGTGGGDFVGDNDDLWGGVDCDPPNYGELVSLGVVELAPPS